LLSVLAPAKPGRQHLPLDWSGGIGGRPFNMIRFVCHSAWRGGTRFLLATAVLWLFPIATFGAAFTAALDRNSVTVGESVTLTLTYDGASNPEAPQLPALPNLTVAASGQSSQFSFLNGQRSTQVTYSYQLTATQPGDVVIPSIQGRASGVVLMSQPLSLRITKTDPAVTASYTNYAFAKLSVPKSEVYLGEPIAITMELYWQDSCRDVHVPQLKADGFSLGQMPRPTQSRTQIGNLIYNRVICQLTATAVRTGPLTLGPAETTMTLVLPVPGARRDFFGNIQGQAHALSVVSEPVVMRVLPLPKENVPPGFNGAIGNYRLNVTAGPTNLTVGDPITVRVQIAGNGPIESLQLPAQTDWRDFNTYPPTSKSEVTDPLGLGGSKTFEQVVIPQNHEIRMLPQLHFSFFDPQAKTYRTLTGPVFPLSIRAASGVAAPAGLTNSGTGPAPQQPDDIIHIRPRLEPDTGAVPLLAVRPWFLGMQSVPLVLWISLLMWRKRSEALANNPRLRRQREVAGRVRAALKELRADAAAQKSAEFFAALFRILQEQLGERLDLPASAITEAVLDERLQKRGLAEDAMRQLHELFQTCNAARYAPTHSSQELSALIPKLESVLHALQQLKA